MAPPAVAAEYQISVPPPVTATFGPRVHPAGPANDGNGYEVKAWVNPLVFWVWFGTLVMIFGTLITLLPDRKGAFKPRVGYEGWKRSMYEQVWFDSRPERALANTLDGAEAEEIVRMHAAKHEPEAGPTGSATEAPAPA